MVCTATPPQAVKRCSTTVSQKVAAWRRTVTDCNFWWEASATSASRKLKFLGKSVESLVFSRKSNLKTEMQCTVIKARFLE